MAQRLSLQQTLSQKLSPQQIQFIKLLQIPTTELLSRVEEELEINPALEEGREDFNQEKEENESGGEEDNNFDNPSEVPEGEGLDDKINLDDYLRDSDQAGYKLQGDGPSPDEDDRDIPMASSNTINDILIQQLSYLPLDDRRMEIGLQLVGSIDNDGYIRRDLFSIANDLAFSQNINTTEEELEDILDMIQQFDPPGIAARTLQECLILQLDRKRGNYEVASIAIQIVEDHFDDFTKKHYEKIEKRLGVEDHVLMKDAINMITHLNPKPGEVSEGNGSGNQFITPDFILINNSGKLELSLNGKNAPELKINRTYRNMLESLAKTDKKSKQEREAIGFIKQKLDSAQWFIDAIRQRQQTLLKTMGAIIDFQYEYFQEGDESKLKPMILKDVASVIEMDISTVSRVTNSKFVQTEFGTFPLKYFFSEGIASTTDGEDHSSREVKSILKEIIDREEKDKPLSDEKLEEMLIARGYQIARRTVAKYREQLNIPVARLRKEI
jgi:RNA polymerase sigma-54 factor